MPCRKLDEYRKLCRIGEGTIGAVYMAVHKTTQEIVALKQVFTEPDTPFPITALREIKALKTLKHENIVQLLHVCVDEKSKSTPGLRDVFYLVLEFCEHDLAGLLSNMDIHLLLCHQKSIMKQMLEGLFFIHHHQFMHRDLKTANILITRRGILKLADFGLCNELPFDSNQNLTNPVVTRWYRPPEIFLGSRHYGPEIDMWGAGCIMAELWLRHALMPGETESEQLELICRLCGSITPESLPQVKDLPLYKKLNLRKETRKLTEHLKVVIKNEYALDMIDQFLQLDPSKRMNADSALNHIFLHLEPRPGRLDELMSKIN